MEIAKLVLEFIKALVWPATVIFLAVFFRKALRALLTRLVKAVLPGGVSLDFRDQIQEAQQLSQQVEDSPAPKAFEAVAPVPTDDVNKQLIALGLDPVRSGLDVDFFRVLAQSDPTVALAALRMDVETLAKDLITACSLPVEKSVSAVRMIRGLASQGAISDPQAALALKIVHICNRAIHGQAVDKVGAIAVIDAASVLFEDFRKWLSTK